MSAFSRFFPLLRLLADGGFHSGLELGEALGASRATVSNQVRAIEEFGLRMVKLRGRGYRLAEPLDLLDAEGLAARLREARADFTVEIADACASTNSELMARVQDGAPQALVLACEYQSAGRGRRGKLWHSGIGTDLTFSVLWRFERGAGALAGLSLAVGVALARALAQLGYAEVQLKWPNDLMLHGRKLGGILIEVTGDRPGPSAVVIGIGLNVRGSPVRTAAVDQPAAALAEAGEEIPSRTVLLAALLVELGLAFEAFARDGFAPFRAEWLQRHAWQGRHVTLRVAEHRVADGEAVGVGEDGALLLRSSRGVEHFHSGELRLAGR